MTDVIHKVLNDITVDDWSVIIGRLSYENVERRSFGADWHSGSGFGHR